MSRCPNNSSRSLKLIQTAAAKVSSDVDKRAQITPILISLHQLPVKSRTVSKFLPLIYKIMGDQAPAYLEQLLAPYNPKRLLCSQNAGILVFPRKL